MYIGGGVLALILIILLLIWLFQRAGRTRTLNRALPLRSRSRASPGFRRSPA